MRYLILAILAITSIRCGKPIISIESEFVPYYESFVREARAEKIGVEGVSISIVFGETIKNNVAECVYGYTAKVIVSRAFWNVTVENMKEALIFHELGHCILNRDHNDALRSDQSPVSIMFRSIFYVNSFDRAYYIHELFHP